MADARNRQAERHPRPPAEPATGIARFGWRNVLYILFVVARVTGTSVRKAAIACGLPTGLMILLLILAQFRPA